ncbi:MAG: hypothetical protein DRP45_11655, partial [Candidatus Zixiibacteriota bacterium]
MTGASSRATRTGTENFMLAPLDSFQIDLMKRMQQITESFFSVVTGLDELSTADIFSVPVRNYESEKDMNLSELKQIVEKNKVEFVDIKLIDLLGAWHHITISVSALNEELFRTGVGVDGSSLPGFSKIEHGDMIMLPDPSSAFMDPFYERPTLSLIGNIMEVNDGISEYSRSPRRVAAASERLLAERLPGAKAILGPEFEFYLFDKVNYHQGPDSAFYFLDSAEAPWEAADDEENLGYKIPYKKG